MAAASSPFWTTRRYLVFSGMESGTARPLRLVIVDDHQIVLDGLKAMLLPYADQVEIVGEAGKPDDAIRIVAEQQPDAVLLDVRLQNASGLDLCADILANEPGCKIVFLTVYDNEQYLYQALRLGAAAYLLKRIEGSELVAYLTRVHEGETLVDPALAEPGCAVRGPGAERGVLAGCAARAQPARERGAGAHGGRAVQPGHRHQALRQRGDGQDALAGDLPQARGERPGRRRRRCPARRGLPVTEGRLGLADAEHEVRLLMRIIETISQVSTSTPSPSGWPW